MPVKKIILRASLLLGVCYLLSGCASVPMRQELPTYSLNGTAYYSLYNLCRLEGMELEYDTFTRTAVLTRGAHQFNLKAKEAMVLVDGAPLQLSHPVDIYEGVMVIPREFKEQVIDKLFGKEIPSAVVFPTAGVKIRRVVIDAGHGGYDPGAIGKTGLREKDVNLDIARRLSSILKARGIDVVMTRGLDKYISLDKRTVIANSCGAQIFISIHSNANRVRSLSGFEVYYITPKINDDKRALDSARDDYLNLNRSYFSGGSANLKAILWDMIYTNNRSESMELARSLCQAMQRGFDTRIIGVKGANFYVLRGTNMPSILVESGFLSNVNEERMLKNSAYRQQVVEALQQGIRNYIADYPVMEASR
ncbi:MAG: N-acetylmuramoyl-L-alanine amidase [Candidatus Omnitrophica bacterium]|nr:N-acetylmuramoyl-L-alanine amidase [Candidatus Omnitrophota bacterium]